MVVKTSNYEISILKVVSTTPSPEKVYPMKFYVIKFVSDLHGSVFFLILCTSYFPTGL